MKTEKQSLIEFATKSLNTDSNLQLNQDVRYALHMDEPLSIEQKIFLRVYLGDILVATNMLSQAQLYTDQTVKKSFWKKFK
jgi:hypothetical protein